MKPNKCGVKLPGALTGTGKGTKRFEVKGPDVSKRPPKTGRDAKSDDE